MNTAECQHCGREFDYFEDEQPKYCARCEDLANEAARDEKADRQRDEEWLGEDTW